MKIYVIRWDEENGTVLFMNKFKVKDNLRKKINENSG